MKWIWNNSGKKHRKKTEVIRGRVKALPTFRHARVPYIFLGESVVNEGHTVIRKGKIIIEKPLILLPENMPQFEGFDLEKDLEVEHSTIQTFFMLRGIRFPSLKYCNTVEKLDLDEAPLAKTAKKYQKELEREENVNTVLILGPEDCWQFSIILYMATLIGRCAKNDIINLMERLHGE